uniref:Phosphatidylinositol 3-kinase n=1 Tax=Octactis speculum TaxID=3111310 RepID=A0A7S2G6Z9_9STRA
MKSNDQELEMYLLQLVAALRYEKKRDRHSSKGSSRHTHLSEAAQLDFADLSPLARFLVDRACTCDAPHGLAFMLYWYLRVESTSDPMQENKEMFGEVLSVYMVKMPEQIRFLLDQQKKLITDVGEAQKKTMNEGGSRDKKQKRMAEILSNIDFSELEAPSFFDPTERLVGVGDKVKMFQSALCPVALTVHKKLTEEEETKLEDDFNASRREKMMEVRKKHEKEGGSLMSEKVMIKMDLIEKASVERERLTKEYMESEKQMKVMFKVGDDVRQDQLVLQLIKVMDECLKKVGMDLKLTSYGVLATSTDTGILEFVSNSNSVELLDKGAAGIGDYLRENQPDPIPSPTNKLGIKKEALDTFSRSLAGYAVITYLLGVGDRHLGNVMMLPDGRFLHIDFGFILGDDPKKKFFTPPPFRITRSMIDAMGGQDSEYFTEFCKHAIGAFLELRKHAYLIMSLLRLMKDAGIDALQTEDKEEKLNFVLKRFHLELDEEEAQSEFMEKIKESLSHIGVQILEGFHLLARLAR